jgi:hypothetical protein
MRKDEPSIHADRIFSSAVLGASPAGKRRLIWYASWPHGSEPETHAGGLEIAGLSVSGLTSHNHGARRNSTGRITRYRSRCLRQALSGSSPTRTLPLADCSCEVGIAPRMPHSSAVSSKRVPCAFTGSNLPEADFGTIDVLASNVRVARHPTRAGVPDCSNQRDGDFSST